MDALPLHLAGDHPLNGTSTLPERGLPAPAAVIASGSRSWRPRSPHAASRRRSGAAVDERHPGRRAAALAGAPDRPDTPRSVRGLLRLFQVDLEKKVAADHDRILAATTDIARIGGAG